MEIIANALQTVAANANVLFTDTVTSGNCSIVHRDDSGLITLRGITNQCRARYRVSFGGNVAIPEGGTVEPISFALAINGEPVGATTMIVTPTVAEAFFNIFSAVFIDVPAGCCSQVSVTNTTAQPIDV
jgi:hypothetical protein